MARDIYVDCIRRNAADSIQSVHKHVQVLRPGASCMVVLADDPRVVEAIRRWAHDYDVRSSVRAQTGYWAVRLFLLPEEFGELPICAYLEHDTPHAA